MPSNANKRKEYRDLKPRQQTQKATKLKDSKILAPKTVRKKLERVKNLITWAFKRKYIAEDVGLAVEYKKTRLEKRKKDSDERDAFSHDDLLAIAHGLATERAHKQKDRNFKGQPARYWVPLLALFTGCRCEELCQLLTSDIYQTNTGIWCIKVDFYGENDEPVKELKTANAVRSLPIHKTLIDLGFLQYWKRMKAQEVERLWPELKNDSRGKPGDPCETGSIAQTAIRG